MDGNVYLEISILTVLAIIFGITYFSILGLKRIYKKDNRQAGKHAKSSVKNTEKTIVTIWLLLTIPLVVVESLQALAAISGFFLFVYVVWLGVIRPTLK